MKRETATERRSNGQEGRVGGSCTRISGVVLHRHHPSSGMWRSRGDTVLCVMRIELRIPLARGQNPDAPREVASTPDARWKGRTRMLRKRRAIGGDAGAHTTEEEVRQGSRVSLCAVLHVVASVISCHATRGAGRPGADGGRDKTPRLALGADGA